MFVELNNVIYELIQSEGLFFGCSTCFFTSNKKFDCANFRLKHKRNFCDYSCKKFIFKPIIEKRKILIAKLSGIEKIDLFNKEANDLFEEWIKKW